MGGHRFLHPVLLLTGLLVAPSVVAQQAPLLNLRPRAEEVRRLELHGDVMMARKRFREAVDFYAQAFQLDRKNAPAANKLGIAYFQVQDFGRAKSWYERALKIDKHFFEPQNNVGMVRYAQHDYKRARRHFEEALKLRPESASAHVNLAATYLALKKNEEAFQEYRLALLLDPQVLEKRSPFGVILQTQSVQDMAQFHFILAKTFAAMGDVERCLAYLRRAIEEGYRDFDRLNSEPAFALILEDVRFQQLLAEPPRAIEP